VASKTPHRAAVRTLPGAAAGAPGRWGIGDASHRVRYTVADASATVGDACLHASSGMTRVRGAGARGLRGRHEA
jgi:hypothetical protein